VPFAPGYGVEIGLLLDTYDRLGLGATGKVNLGVRKHRKHPLSELGVLSRQIIGTMMRRCGVEDSGAGLTQFLVDGDSFVPTTTEVALTDRPPMNTVCP
jgi:glucosyl-3-phosphoglycerate synthase